MKKISTLLLTLMLSVSMLAPDLAALSVYANDEAPAVQNEQVMDAAEAGQAGAADNAAAGTSDGANAAAGADESGASGADGEAVDASADQGGDGEAADSTAGSDESGTNGAGDGTNAEAGSENGDTAADASVDSSAAVDSESSAAADGAEEGDGEGTEDPDEPTDPAEPAATEAPEADLGAYSKINMDALDDAGAFVIPEDMKDKITVTHAANSAGVLVNGTVADLNSTYITLNNNFDFSDGSVGRLMFDGLKDKDSGMTVNVEIYLDDSESPTVTFPLKKQMGKKEWANKGDKSFSMGEDGISGKHKVALRLNITGKKESAKTTVLFRSIQFCRTTLPVLYFNIDENEGTVEAMNASTDHSVECYGKVDLVVPNEFANDQTFSDEYGKQKSLYGVDLEYIRGRGNSTWGDDKKPYKVKFDKGQDLFGFGKNKHWVLLANRFDNSLIRNRMTYWLGQQLGMEYTPQCVPVEVVMNGEFYGSYLLCEQIRVGKGRVEIDDLDDLDDDPALADDVIKSGGYLLSMDYEEDELRKFTTKQKMNFYIESPDDNVSYFNEVIKAYVQKAENALFGDGFKDEKGSSYTDFIDLDAVVDYWWIQEFSENGDAYGSGSTYLYKKRVSDTEPGKLYWGPLWDFDYVAWGDLDYESSPSETLDYTDMPWSKRMKQDPEFINKARERWLEEGGIKEKMQDVVKKGGLLDKYIGQMETSYKYDHEKWGAYESELTEYKGEIEQLRLWINRRIKYVDSEVENWKIEDHVVKFVVDGKTVKTVTAHGFLNKKDFPADPKKKGYLFYGWTDKDGNEYEPDSKVNADLTLKPYFISESSIVHAKYLYFRTYDAYVGIYSGSGGYNYEGESALSYFYPDAEVWPENAWETDITYTSSDESIAAARDEFGAIAIKGYGDVTITGTLSNGVKKSFKLHIVKDDDVNMFSDLKLNAATLKLKRGYHYQLLASPTETPAYPADVMWLSSNEKIATVDDLGVVKGISPGTTEILAIDTENRTALKCKVTVTSEAKPDPKPNPDPKPKPDPKPVNNYGKVVQRNGSYYKITADQKNNKRCMLIKAKNARKVVVPAYIMIGKRKYNVTKIQAKAFAKSKAKWVTIKTTWLIKSRVKSSLKGSKVRKLYIRVGSKALNKKYIKKYKKIFTQKNAGKGVVVK